MSKTPMTDAIHCRLVKASEGKDWIAGKDYCDMRAHAAKLETDRAELVGEVERLADAIEDSLDGSASMPGYATVKRLRALLDRMEADK